MNDCRYSRSNRMKHSNFWRQMRFKCLDTYIKTVKKPTVFEGKIMCDRNAQMLDCT